MPAFFDYLRNITYYLLFASLIGMVAPAGKYKQYVKLVTGFILLFLIIQPLSAFINNPGVPVTDWLNQVAPVMENDYGFAYESALRSAFADQLNIQLDNLLRQSGYALVEADYNFTPELNKITDLFLTVDTNQTTDNKQPFIRIEPVHISGFDDEETNADIEAVKKLVGSFYSLPTTHIHVNIQK